MGSPVLTEPEGLTESEPLLEQTYGIETSSENHIRRVRRARRSSECSHKRAAPAIISIDQVPSGTLTPEKLSDTERTLWNSVLKFYDKTNHVERIILPLVAKTSKVIPMRSFSWLAASYQVSPAHTDSGGGPTYFVTFDNKLVETDRELIEWQKSQLPEDKARATEFHLRISYLRMIGIYTTKYFDCNRRGPLLAYPLSGDRVFLTTLAQLNFFCWAIRWKVIDYLAQHHTEVHQHMTLHATPRAIGKRKTTADADIEPSRRRKRKFPRIRIRLLQI